MVAWSYTCRLGKEKWQPGIVTQKGTHSYEVKVLTVVATLGGIMHNK